MAVLGILAVLFVALIIIIPLAEKSNMRISQETQAKLTKWILPAIVIILIVQLFIYM